MATVLAPPAVAQRAAGAYDRVFYSGMAIAMAVTVLVGFGPTYYFRALNDTPTFSGLTELPSLVHVHGALFTAWTLLLVVQTQLVARRQLGLHRRLGLASVALAAALVVVGWQTTVAAGRRGAAPPGLDALVFLVVPVFDILLFAVFVSAAIVLRRNKEAHKRLMLLAYVSMLTAAVARLPGVMALGPPGFFGLTFVFVLIGVAYDLFSRRRVHPVYAWGGLLLALSMPGRLVLSGTPLWRSFAEWVVR
jgi:hypothetical protein